MVLFSNEKMILRLKILEEIETKYYKVQTRILIYVPTYIGFPRNLIIKVAMIILKKGCKQTIDRFVYFITSTRLSDYKINYFFYALGFI